jgi:hypothetical protein
MSVMKDLRNRWFVTMLSAAAGLFFAGALALSTLTYVSVMEAREGVELRNAVESAELLSNGSLKVSLSIELVNPSPHCLRINSISWSVRIDNTTAAPLFIPVTTAYTGASAGIVVDANDGMTLGFEGFVSDPERLAAIRGFANYSAGSDDDYTIEILPYLHDFRVVAWIDNFDHDYQYYRELYLNDMVRIERSYYGGEYR